MSLLGQLTSSTQPRVVDKPHHHALHSFLCPRHPLRRCPCSCGPLHHRRGRLSSHPRLAHRKASRPAQYRHRPPDQDRTCHTASPATYSDGQSDSVTQIQALNGSDIASENQLTAYLSDIGNNLDIANVAIGSVVVRKRDISDHPKENSVGARDISDHPKVSVIDARAEEIDEVAQVLASIIADITNAINDVSDDLKNLPAIVSDVVMRE